MGNTQSRNIKYDLKVIFFGNVPQRIITNIEQNNAQIEEHIENGYFLLKKYKWYMYLRLNNQRITTINNIQYILLIINLQVQLILR